MMTVITEHFNLESGQWPTTKRTWRGSGEVNQSTLTYITQTLFWVFESHGRWKSNFWSSYLRRIPRFDGNDSCVRGYIDESNCFPSSREEVCFYIVDVEFQQFIVSCDWELARSCKTCFACVHWAAFPLATVKTYLQSRRFSITWLQRFNTTPYT